MQWDPCVFVAIGGEVGTRCLQTTVNCPLRSSFSFPKLSIFHAVKFKPDSTFFACGSTAVIDHLCKETFFHHLAIADDCGVDNLKDLKWSSSQQEKH